MTGKILYSNASIVEFQLRVGDYNNLVCVADFYPIISSLVNINIKDNIDGINLWPDIGKQCNLKGRNKNEQIIKRDEIISYRLSNDNMFDRVYVRTDEYKLLINPNHMGNPMFQFDFLENWVNDDGVYYVEPNETYYQMYNEYDESKYNQNLFYSKCYENYLADPIGNEINTQPYIDENNNKLYLFKIKEDNIEACNVALDEMEKANELFDRLQSTINVYAGSVGIYGEKGGYVAMRDSYNWNVWLSFMV